MSGRPVEHTEDGHFVVIDGRKWRATDPDIPAERRDELGGLQKIIVFDGSTDADDVISLDDLAALGDAYLAEHPAALLDQPVEPTLLHPDNPYLLGPQLAAAAQELPLTPADAAWFGPRTGALAERLAATGALRRRRAASSSPASASSRRRAPASTRSGRACARSRPTTASVGPTSGPGPAMAAKW